MYHVDSNHCSQQHITLERNQEQEQQSIYESAFDYCFHHAVTEFLDDYVVSNSNDVESVTKDQIGQSNHHKLEVETDTLENYTISTKTDKALNAVNRSMDVIHLGQSQQQPSSPALIDIVDNWDGTFCFDPTNHHFLVRPCLIRNCTLLQQCFELPRKSWLMYHNQEEEEQQTNNVGGNLPENIENCSESNPIGINRRWFIDICQDELVPVYWNHVLHDETISNDSNTLSRIENNQKKLSLLDNDGRAVELPIQYMKIQDYIADYLLKDNTDIDIKENTKISISYLKDWHFQLWYELHYNIHVTSTSSSSSSSQIQYRLPNYLPYDLLNGFLLRFDPNAKNNGTIPSTIDTITTTNSNYNDYRFVYWGPSKSNTTIHTDVLLSLSWSYNVYGTKLWTFYLPNTTINSKEHDNNSSESNSNDGIVVTIEQRTGELILVPSGIKHSVMNQEETLSINHNWITSDILLNVLDCIRLELIAVDNELLSWQSNWSVTCYDARESMLRGCVGLNISLYFFMILTRGLDLLHSSCRITNSNTSSPLENCDEFIVHDLNYICKALLVLLNDPLIHLQERLQSTLRDANLSEHALRIARNYTIYVQNNRNINSKGKNR